MMSKSRIKFTNSSFVISNDKLNRNKIYGLNKSNSDSFIDYSSIIVKKKNNNKKVTFNSNITNTWIPSNNIIYFNPSIENSKFIDNELLNYNIIRTIIDTFPCFSFFF